MHVWMAHQASGRVRAHGRASAFSSLPIVIDLEAYSPVTLRQNSALSIEWQLAVLQSDREPLSTGRHRPNAVAYAGPLAAIRTMDQKAADIALPSAIGTAATNYNSSARDGVTLVTCAITCWFDIPRSTSALIS